MRPRATALAIRAASRGRSDCGPRQRPARARSGRCTARRRTRTSASPCAIGSASCSACAPAIWHDSVSQTRTVIGGGGASSGVDDVEVVIERRDFVDLGHRELHLLRQRDEVRRRTYSRAHPGSGAGTRSAATARAARRRAAPARRRAPRHRPGGPSDRPLTPRPRGAATYRRSPSRRSEARTYSRKSQYFSTCAARSSECCRTSRSASSVSRRSSASMIRM